MQNGPFDTSNVKCYVPTGCCPVSACAITLDDFMCAVRALLPEGEVFNTTKADTQPPTPTPPVGVGCFTVGCDPVCGENVEQPLCDDTTPAPQLAIVDAFAATSYGVVERLCCMLAELDPCTAVTTVDRWLARYGVPLGACDPSWSDEVKSLLVCIMSRISHNFVLNKANLTALGTYFGVVTTIYNAGQINCGGGMPGLITLARAPRFSRGCADVGGCGDAPVPDLRQKTVTWGAPCTVPPSIDLVVCRAETVVAENCLLPGAGYTVTPTQELYDAFLWLLDKLISAGTDICVYRCEDVPCLENA